MDKVLYNTTENKVLKIGDKILTISTTSTINITSIIGIDYEYDSDVRIYGKYNSMPTSESDYDFIYGGFNHTVLPTAPGNITSLYLWADSPYISEINAPGYGWVDYAVENIKILNAVGYSNAIKIDFTETIAGSTFNGTLALRTSMFS